MESDDRSRVAASLLQLRARKRVWQSPSDDIARAFLGRKGDVSPGRSGPGGVGWGGVGGGGDRGR
jgi:hypothetical protein